VARKLSLLLTIGSLFSLALASGALAAGVGNHRAVSRPHPAPTSVSQGGSLIASPSACPGQEDLAAGASAQEQTMRCMTDFARVQAGIGSLSDSQQLDLSAQEKSADVLGCDSFSHEACGREFSYWMRQSGYMSSSCWHVGENLAWGAGEYGTVRSIFRAWMRSPEHRHNILGDYSEMGIDLATGDLEGETGTHVWTEHFGSHCETQQ
jgi:uncharacterized protein YkwD